METFEWHNLHRCLSIFFSIHSTVALVTALSRTVFTTVNLFSGGWARDFFSHWTRSLLFLFQAPGQCPINMGGQSKSRKRQFDGTFEHNQHFQEI